MSNAHHHFFIDTKKLGLEKRIPKQYSIPCTYLSLTLSTPLDCRDSYTSVALYHQVDMYKPQDKEA